MTTRMDNDLTITIERVFRAPPEKVFDAWTTPAKLAQWFGPEGFTTRTDSFDLRPGGEWRFTMIGPDGKEYPNHIRFLEVEKPGRLVYDHLSAPAFRTTVTFEREGSGTRMRFSSRFADANAFKVATEVHGAREGAKQTLARLALVVDGFTLERDLRASPEKVWRMLTTKEGIESWWGPSSKEMGFGFRVREMDVRPGGTFAFEMTGEQTIVNHGTYTEVRAPWALAWTWRFDIFLPPGVSPYDVPISVTLDRTPQGGTHLELSQGALHTPEDTKGSRGGVELQLRHLAAALGE